LFVILVVVNQWCSVHSNTLIQSCYVMMCIWLLAHTCLQFLYFQKWSIYPVIQLPSQWWQEEANC
jgi:hypothetical protein